MLPFLHPPCRIRKHGLFERARCGTKKHENRGSSAKPQIRLVNAYQWQCSKTLEIDPSALYVQREFPSSSSDTMYTVTYFPHDGEMTARVPGSNSEAIAGTSKKCNPFYLDSLILNINIEHVCLFLYIKFYYILYNFDRRFDFDLDAIFFCFWKSSAATDIDESHRLPGAKCCRGFRGRIH